MGGGKKDLKAIYSLLSQRLYRWSGNGRLISSGPEALPIDNQFLDTALTTRHSVQNVLLSDLFPQNAPYLNFYSSCPWLHSSSAGSESLRPEKPLMMIKIIVVEIITALIYRKPPRWQDSVQHSRYAASLLVVNQLQLPTPYSASFPRQVLPKSNYQLLFYTLTSRMILMSFLS